MKGRPVSGAQIFLQADNGTTVDGETDSEGKCQIEVTPLRPCTLLAAHPGHPGEIAEAIDPTTPVSLVMRDIPETGSLIIRSNGYIPGFKGRLNPVTNPSRHYFLYADNISIDGNTSQPAPCEIGALLALEGTTLDLTVRRFFATVALLDDTRSDS